MATPFDAAAKDLIEMAPADWLAFLGQPRPPEFVRVIDADLSATVSTSTDKVIRVDDPEPWLLMIELQANWDGDLPFSLHKRYALLRDRHRVPVSCAIVLLRPEANTTAMTGRFPSRTDSVRIGCSRSTSSACGRRRRRYSCGVRWRCFRWPRSPLLTETRWTV